MVTMQHPRYFENHLNEQDPGEDVAAAQKDYVPELLTIINKNCSPVPENCDGGLYVGAAGIAFAFYHVAESPVFPDKKEQFLSIAEKYIKVSLREIKKVDPVRVGTGPSLLLGHAGIYGTAALIYEALGLHSLRNENVQSFYALHKLCLPLNFFYAGSDELFVGRAGYLAMCLMLNKRFKQTIVSNDITLALCNTIIESGRQYSRRIDHPSPLMYSYYDTLYLGAAHGVAAILQVLLSYPECFSGKPEVEADLKGTADFILSCEQQNGNYAPVPGEVRDDWNELVHWCHGAPGIVHLLAKAYMVWKEEKFLAACLRCGDLVWERGLLKKGPGICHGIAGNGYVFLLLYRLTNDDKHLRRARQFAAFMQTEEFKAHSRVPDAPYSLFEGIAGTACFLTDLVCPKEASFPFMDIFD